MSLLVIEGLDGAGKSTQIKKVCSYLEQHDKPYKYLHFPRVEEGVFGDLVARFLRGDLGKNDEVNPYLVALIYAGDRNDAAKEIKQWLNYNHPGEHSYEGRVCYEQFIEYLEDLEYDIKKINNDDKFILCYVKTNDEYNQDIITCYFTTQKLEDQRGDDWNDCPYQHNAGEPYLPRESDQEKWEIKKLVLYNKHETLHDPSWEKSNNGICVDDINLKNGWWLESQNRNSHIYAGTTLDKFREIIDNLENVNIIDEEIIERTW